MAAPIVAEFPIHVQLMNSILFVFSILTRLEIAPAELLTLGAHAQRGLRYLVCVCVTQHHVTIHATKHLWPNEGQNFKRFSLEILPSKVMASFTYHGQRPRRYFVFPLTEASLIT